MDLWCAPLVTGLFALLTHAQPAWADLHALLAQVLSGAHAPAIKSELSAADNDLARAVCVLVLTSLFVSRTLTNFGPAAIKEIKLNAKSSSSSTPDGVIKAIKARQSLTPGLSEKEGSPVPSGPSGGRNRTSEFTSLLVKVDLFIEFSARSASVKLKTQ